jgi:cytochrome c oxidase assembly protein subunit 15
MQVQPRRAGGPPADFDDVLAIAMGTTVAMWAVVYVGHMPLASAPPAACVSLMLLCLLGGGGMAGRYGRRGVIDGLWVGLIAAAMNLLILGNLLVDPNSGQFVPGAWLWLPGWFALSAALTVSGTVAGRITWRSAVPPLIPWLVVFAWITCAAAVLLIAIGGLVTGFRAGMAVPDWPNTYGWNMFLYPLARMTGGVFYEHAHRLLGTLVGLATLVLAIRTSTAAGQGRGLAACVWATGLCVVVQGILGGFRVTANSPALAVVHGFFAHAILAALVAAAAVASRCATGSASAPAPPGSGESGRFDRQLAGLAAGLILLQTLLGTLVRQLDAGLLIHVTTAAVVALVALGAGMRAWGLHGDAPVVRRGGLALMLLILLQINLGIVALAMRTPPVDTSPSAADLEARPGWLPVRPLPALATTAHQTTAAFLLAVAVALAVGPGPKDRNP